MPAAANGVAEAAAAAAASAAARICAAAARRQPDRKMSINQARTTRANRLTVLKDWKGASTFEHFKIRFTDAAFRDKIPLFLCVVATVFRIAELFRANYMKTSCEWSKISYRTTISYDRLEQYECSNYSVQSLLSVSKSTLFNNANLSTPPFWVW